MRGISWRSRLGKAARGFALRQRGRLVASCASVMLAMAGAVCAPTSAYAAFACSFDASGSPVGTQLTGHVQSDASLLPCYPGSLGFAGFSTANNQNFDGTVAVTTGVGFATNAAVTDFVPKPTTLTSGDGHAKVLFNMPGVAGTLDFSTINFTVLSTDGSSSAVFNFFCDSQTGGGDTFFIDTPCNLTIQLPPALPPTATVAASPSTISTGGISSLTFTLTNPGLALSGVADSVTLPSNVVVATPPNASSSCGTFTPTAGATSLAVSGGTLGAGASCTFKVDVTSNVTGAKTIPTGTPSATGAAAGVAGPSTTLNVNGPLTTTQAVPSTTLTVGSAATPFTPVTATGGIGTLSFALSGGTLPTGLNFSTTTGQIIGTPSTTLATTTFTVTVTDQTTPTAQTSSKTFSLTVNAALTTTQAVPSTTLTVGSAATAFTPVTATGGTGTLSYALSGGTLPTGLNFSTTTGQITGTPSTALATTTFTVTVTDQTTPTAQTSSKTFSLTVNAALTTTQAVPSTTLTVGSAATPFTPVTATGGTGTLSYALSGGTLPTGLNFSTATGQITGTPSTALATTTFTVTVTDQTTPTAQTSAKTFSLTVNGPLTTTQAVPSTTLTVGSAATPFTPVTAAGGTGTLSYALSGGTLPTGLNFSTTTGQITGTPSTALATTTFTVTVTDQTTPTAQTSSKTFSLTAVNAPLTTTQAVPSTTLTVGSAATAFTPVTAAGGTGTLSYALSGGTLPTGLNFSTTTGQITGTPSTTLAATIFTVTVTDQSTPTPQTSAKTFSLTVNAALTTTQAVPSTTLSVGGIAPPFTPVTASGGTGTLSFALSGGTLPTGLNFSTTTGQISGTPSTVLAATIFTVTVTDQTTPTAQSSAKTFSLTVTPSIFSFTPPAGALPAGVAGSAYNQTITIAGGLAPDTFSIVAGALPAGLTLNASTGVISGTPTTAGGASFTVSIRDANNQTGSAAYTINITAPAIMAVSSSATTFSGATVTVDLTIGASGGPFTSAQLLSLTPASAGSALITLGDTASNSNMVVAALISGGHFLLKFTPAATFTGVAVATFTISNAFATSAPATITFTVNPRPDPSKDAEVIGLVNAQAQSAQHFASTQITNFNDRLESLHDDSCHRNSFRLGLNDTRSIDNDPLHGYGPKTNGGSNDTGAFGAAAGSGSGNTGASNSVASGGSDGTGRSRHDTTKKHDDPTPNGCDRDEAERKFAAWTGGYVNFGRLGTSFVNTGIDYVSTGISAGIDYWFSPAFVGGFGIGYGNDRSTIGNNGTTSNALSYSMALYGSWHPTSHTFLDAVIGYGLLSFDSDRYITGSSGAFAAGSRSGHQLFGSMTSGYEYKANGFLVSPYGRVSASWSILDSFTESGGGIFALQYGMQSIDSFTGGFGVRTAYEIREAWGIVTPRMRLEYAHEFAGASTAFVAYADLVGIGGLSYALPITPTGSDYVTAGLGTDLNFISGWLVSIDYRTAFGQEKTPPQMLQVKVGTKF